MYNINNIDEINLNLDELDDEMEQSLEEIKYSQLTLSLAS